MRRLIAAVLAAGLMGCGAAHYKAERTMRADIQVSAPAHVWTFADGTRRCSVSGPMDLILKAEPGTCLKAGADGVLRECE